MFKIHATGKWFRKDIVRHTANLEVLHHLHSRCVALKYPQVYISRVDVGEEQTATITPPLTISALARDRELQTGFTMSTQTQKVINIRIGKHLLKMVSHFANQRNQSQNAFILDAVRYCLNKNLADKTMSLADFAAITHEKDQYSIRLEKSLLDMVDEKAKEINASRSAWLFWALMVFMNSKKAQGR